MARGSSYPSAALEPVRPIRSFGAWLPSQHKAWLQTQFAYLTFIKEIAKAFRSDYNDGFVEHDPDDGMPRISTLHSLACRLTRNRGFSLGYDGPLFFASFADTEALAATVFLNDLLPLSQRSLNSDIKSPSKFDGFDKAGVAEGSGS